MNITKRRLGAASAALWIVGLLGVGGAAQAAGSDGLPRFRTVSVASCAIPIADYGGTPNVPETPPRTVRVAASLAPPKGAQIYGARFPGSPPSYLLGTASATCQGTWSSADGGEFMAVTPISNESEGVTMVLRAGGVGPETDLACPYIPSVLAADQAMRGTASLCTRPSQDVVHQIPTERTNFYAAVVRVPAQVKDPNLNDSGNGMEPTVALYTAQVIPMLVGDPSPTAVGQMIACTLPPKQRDICTVSLEFFLATQSDLGTHVGKANLKKLESALSAFVNER